MINPLTGMIIPIFSKEILNLLDQGYTLEQLLNIDQSQLPILTTSPHIPFTGNPDIDLTILENMNHDEIMKVCNVNQYTRNLCKRKDFWMKMIEKEGITIPDIKIKNIDWMNLYDALYQSTYIIENMDDDNTYYITAKITKNNFLILLQKIGIKDFVDDDEITYISIDIFDDNHYILSINDNFTIHPPKDSIILFLIYMHYYDFIINGEWF